MGHIRFGDLSEHINDGLTEEVVYLIGCQILDGLQIMHRLDIVHRDIKPSNILVVSKHPNWWVKISDFSIAKSTLTQSTTLHTNVGTDAYRAPEVARLIHTKKTHCYDSKCDIWSFGYLLYELMTTSVPFTDIGDLIDYCRGITPFAREPLSDRNASRQSIAFLEELLRPLPDDRPSASDALRLHEDLLENLYRPNDSVNAEDTSISEGADIDHTPVIYIKDPTGNQLTCPWPLCCEWEALWNYLAVNYRQLASMRPMRVEGPNEKVITRKWWRSSIFPGIQLILKTKSLPFKPSGRLEEAAVPDFSLGHEMHIDRFATSLASSSVVGKPFKETTERPHIAEKIRGRLESSESGAHGMFTSLDDSNGVANVWSLMWPSRTRSMEAINGSDDEAGAGKD